MEAIKPGSAAAAVSLTSQDQGDKDGTYVSMVFQPDTKPVAVINSTAQLASNQFEHPSPPPPETPDSVESDADFKEYYDEIPDLQEFNNSDEEQNQTSNSYPLATQDPAQFPINTAIDVLHEKGLELANLQPSSEPSAQELINPPASSETLCDVLPTFSLPESSSESQPAIKQDNTYEDVGTDSGNGINAQAVPPPPLPKPRTKRPPQFPGSRVENTDDCTSSTKPMSIEIDANQIKMLIEMHEMLTKVTNIYETPKQPPKPRPRKRTLSNKRESGPNEVGGASIENTNKERESASLTVEQCDTGGETVATHGQGDVAGMKHKLGKLSMISSRVFYIRSGISLL